MTQILLQSTHKSESCNILL